jgi:hypothetical protein
VILILFHIVRMKMTVLKAKAVDQLVEEKSVESANWFKLEKGEVADNKIESLRVTEEAATATQPWKSRMIDAPGVRTSAVIRPTMVRVAVQAFQS